MVKAFLTVARLFVTVPVFEFVGVALVVAAAWGAGGVWWGLGVAGGFCLLKAFDMSLPKGS